MGCRRSRSPPSRHGRRTGGADPPAQPRAASSLVLHAGARAADDVTTQVVERAAIEARVGAGDSDAVTRVAVGACTCDVGLAAAEVDAVTPVLVRGHVEEPHLR